MKIKNFAAIFAAIIVSSTFTLAACIKTPDSLSDALPENTPVQPSLPEAPDTNPQTTPQSPEANTPTTPETDTPTVDTPTQTPEVETPQVKTADYFLVTGESVNIRSGAGSSYSVLGVAEKSTLYLLVKSETNWYQTYYKGKRGYVSKSYAAVYSLPQSDSSSVEKVIEEGGKLLGTKYVYGATRYHNGSGKLLSGFTTTTFDCSSLMQYIFYKGAGVLLDVNTRTQVVQGKAASSLKRGDLMFFTNESRKNLSGIERIGHVALYLGGNYILHTASDYAKIEQISSSRWSYYITARRFL